MSFFQNFEKANFIKMHINSIYKPCVHDQSAFFLVGVDPHHVGDVVYVLVHSLEGVLAFSAIFVIFEYIRNYFLKPRFFGLFGSYMSHVIEHRKALHTCWPMSRMSIYQRASRETSMVKSYGLYRLGRYHRTRGSSKNSSKIITISHDKIFK